MSAYERKNAKRRTPRQPSQSTRARRSCDDDVRLATNSMSAGEAIAASKEAKRTKERKRVKTNLPSLIDEERRYCGSQPVCQEIPCALRLCSLPTPKTQCFCNYFLWRQKRPGFRVLGRQKELAGCRCCSRTWTLLHPLPHSQFA